jgi:L-lactate dehydrogenase complex protein LldE
MDRTGGLSYLVAHLLESGFTSMPGKVSLFVTCVVDQVFPRVGMAMAEVLERIGYQPEFREDQTCCGQPAFNSGYHRDAAQVAEHFIRVFRDAEYIIVPSGSCTAMISHHFLDLFPKDSALYEEAEYLGPRVFEFSRFLTEVAKVDDVGARFNEVVTYHDSCHALRELRIKESPRRLLRKVRGLELREMSIAEECCGFGGTFSVKFPEVSGGMARTKIDSILATGASTVVSIDSSCLMQLQGVISRAQKPIRTLHLAEVLASQ